LETCSETAESVHDFRNILSTISGLVEMALLELEQAGPLKSMLTGIRDACADGGVLCCRMLDNACNAAFDDEALDLSDVVNEMSVQIRACLPPEATLRLELTETAPVEAPAPGRIRQVLLNLVRNAAEAFGDGAGTVTVSTGTAALEPSACDAASQRTGEPNSSYSFLAVADSGTGMSEAMRAELLNRSFTTKAYGHGLGMASVRRIVHACGGKIQILSQLDRGTQVRVLFPQQQLDDALLADDALWSEDVADQTGESGVLRPPRAETSASRLIRTSVPRSVTPSRAPSTEE
jgi:signal transduction histidine kinase